MVRFLKYFTEIEITKLTQIIADEKNINNLKILLANEATKILHGEKASKNSEKTAKETFANKGVGENLPEIIISKLKLSNGLTLIDLLTLNNIMTSKSEARRAIKNNGIKINDFLINDEKKIINLNDFINESYMKLSYGKKKHYIVKII